MVDTSAEKSILETICPALGVLETDTSMMYEIVMYINAALDKAKQYGIGDSTKHLSSPEDTMTFSEFLGPQADMLTDGIGQLLPQLVLLSAKILFDPPLPATITYMEKSIDEGYWRLREEYDSNSDSINDDEFAAMNAKIEDMKTQLSNISPSIDELKASVENISSNTINLEELDDEY